MVLKLIHQNLHQPTQNIILAHPISNFKINVLELSIGHIRRERSVEDKMVRNGGSVISGFGFGGKVPDWRESKLATAHKLAADTKVENFRGGDDQNDFCTLSLHRTTERARFTPSIVATRDQRT